jgi:hypothetical protein
MLKGRLGSIAVAVCLVAMLVPVVPAFAGQSAQLTGTAMMENVSVTLVTTSTLDYGSGAPGATVTKSFTARNSGSLAADWDLIGSDATATAGGDCWSICNMAMPNMFCWTASGTGLNTIKLNKTSWLRLADAVPAYTNKDVDLAFKFPTTSNSAIAHTAVATLRATASGGGATTAQGVTFDTTIHPTMTAPANTPLNITFDPSTAGCATTIAFTSGSFTKTSAAGQNVTYHTDGLPAGTYQWKCDMDNCHYGTLVVQ